MIDRDHGRATGITLWQSEATRDATDGAMRGVREDASRAMGGGVPDVRLYEVPVHDLREIRS